MQTANSMAPTSLQDLPDEVVQNILEYVSFNTALSLSTTSRRFHNLANEPRLWKSYCLNDFRYWSASHKRKEKLRDASCDDWKALYISRAAAPRPTRHLINHIVNNPTGQIDTLSNIVGLGYDAKDTLLNLFHSSPSSPNHLAQKYWSHIALGCLHRSMALDEWQNLKLRDVNDDSLERAVGAFDLFILDERDSGDLDDIHDVLDSYAQAIRDDHPEIDDLAPRHKASVVAAYLLQKRWTGITEGRPYHALDHMFLGVALHSPSRNSLPLITVLIYCYVTRQFNLQAAPIGYPWHVHAVVRPPPGIDLDGNPTPTDGTDTRNQLYMDPFNNAEPVPRAQLNQQLTFIAPQLTPSQRESFLRASNAREMTIRTARNILKSDTAVPRLFPINPVSAIYAANWASVLVPASVDQLRQSLYTLMHDFRANWPFDIALFETHVLPLTGNLPNHQIYREVCWNMRAEDMRARVPKRREGMNAGVKYRVGQMFVHRRRRYVGVIWGWDASCKMDEDWIQMNQVGSLPGGRNQPFYNVL
jgi:F-box protein 21